MSDRTKNNIYINVSGVRFVTWKGTFSNLPNTKLFAIHENFKDFYDPVSMEFFFDCDPNVFASVLSLYRKGSLHIPRGMCGVLIKEELSFWGISETMISPCCLKPFYKSFNDMEVHMFLKEEIAFTQKKHQSAEDESINKCKTFVNKLGEHLWLFLMNPKSSRCSKVQVWHLIYMAIVLMSLSIYCFDHVEYFHEDVAKKFNFTSDIVKDVQNKTIDGINIHATQNSDKISSLNENINNSESKPLEMMSNNKTVKMKNDLKENDLDEEITFKNESSTARSMFVRHTVEKEMILPFFAIDRLFNFIFCIEFILRFLACPKKKKLITFLNFAEFISIIGFSITFHLGKKWNHLLQECGLFCDVIKLRNDNLTLFSFLVIGNVLLVFRNFRFFMIGRLNSGFNMLLFAVRRSSRELLIFTLTILFNALIFAGFIFYAENEESIADFFDACYWAVVTMTTVGYGDIRPKNRVGKLVAALCSISGLFLLTMPVSVISGNFNQLYRHYSYIQYQNKVTKKTKTRNSRRIYCSKCTKCCS